MLLATLVLWERLGPDIKPLELVSSQMQQGYDLFEKRNLEETCSVWQEVWNYVRDKLPQQIKDVREADNFYQGAQSLFNWSMDYEQALDELSRKEPRFYEQRAKFCREFCARFPHSEDQRLRNMKTAEALSYFGMGSPEKGEEIFENLVERFPEWGWTYVRWGDAYKEFEPEEFVSDPKDKAEQLYRRALQELQDDLDKSAARNRLKRLREEEG